jgi:NADPH:quinone reductase-like Zn-dependent oxidoreductase
MNRSEDRMPTNTAAWLPGNGRLLEIGPAEYPTAGPGELVVRAEAVAVNPVDWIVQLVGSAAYRWLSHPAVLGEDVAGEVVEVGAGVTRFAPGDRVVGLAVGTEQDRNRPAEGAFQQFVVLAEALAAPIPEDVDAVHAAVVPLTLSTAATGLFVAKNLGLRPPGSGQREPGERGTVLVWGAGTAVGASAVQLAGAAGYEVVATASPRTAELVRGLGASDVLDRTDPRIVDRLVERLRGGDLAGVLAVGAGSSAPCVEVAARAGGARAVATASTAVTFERLTPGRAAMVRALPTLLRLGLGETAVRIRARRRGVRLAAIWGSDLRHTDVGPAIWRDFLPGALTDGRFRPFPEPVVVGHGLASLQQALDQQRQGMAARKAVVTL